MASAKSNKTRTNRRKAKKNKSRGSVLTNTFKSYNFNSTGTSNPYTGSIIFPGTSARYIHLHRGNIGAAEKGKIFQNDQDLANYFRAFKKDAGTMAKKHFNALLIKNLDKETLQGLDASLNPEEFMDDVLTATKEAINDRIMKTNKLKNIQDLIDRQSRIDYSAIVDKKSIGELQKLFATIDEVSSMIETDKEVGELLKSLGDNTSNAKTVKGLSGEAYRKITALIEKTDKDGKKIFSEKPQVLQDTLTQLQTVCKNINTNWVGTDIKDRKASLRTAIGNNMFDTLFAEALGQKSFNIAFKGISDTFENSKSGRGQGQKTTEKYEYIGNGKFEAKEKTAAYGKADIKLKNVQLSIGENQNSIKLNLGVSMKTYSSIALKKNQIVDFGQGVLMGEAIKRLFTEERDRYLAFNAVAWGAEERSASISALEDIILIRNIVPLIAARGISDMAQFVLINNQLISIIDLINYAISQDNSGSLSIGTSISGLALSLEGRMTLTNDTLNKRNKDGEEVIMSQSERVREINARIETMKIMAKIHVTKLIQGMENKGYSVLKS